MGSRLAEQKVAAANQRKSLFPEPRRHFASALRCGCSVRLKGSIGRAEKLGGDAFRGLTVMHGWEEGSSRVLKQTLFMLVHELQKVFWYASFVPGLGSWGVSNKAAWSRLSEVEPRCGIELGTNFACCVVLCRRSSYELDAAPLFDF